ncbi:hypothetical protein JG687_00011610, partial [Phytophthora cactorum]
VRLIQRQRDRCLYQKVSHQILEQHYDHSTSAEDTGLDERQTHSTADAELRGRSNRTVCVHAVEHQLQSLEMPRPGFLEKDYLLLRQHGYAVTPQHKPTPSLPDHIVQQSPTKRRTQLRVLCLPVFPMYLHASQLMSPLQEVGPTYDICES